MFIALAVAFYNTVCGAGANRSEEYRSGTQQNQKSFHKEVVTDELLAIRGMLEPVCQRSNGSVKLLLLQQTRTEIILIKANA